MFLRKNIENKISEFGGVQEFKLQMEIVKKTQPLSKKYIFDVWIMYVNMLGYSKDLEVTEDVLNLKEDIEGYLLYFEEIVKTNDIKVIHLCIDIMKFNLQYINNLRLFAS